MTRKDASPGPASQPYPVFDVSRLCLRPVSERVSDYGLPDILPLTPCPEVDPAFADLAKRILAARERGAAVVFLAGAHVLRVGVQRYLVDLVRRGAFTCLAVNGAFLIHDFELALIGATTESVRRYIESGQFGLWRETGRLNDIIAQGAGHGLGLGQAVAEAVAGGDFPHKDLSVAAACQASGTILTAHVGIGYDIIHEHPNCDGAALGATSYRDFLAFARVLESLEGGIAMSFGSQVMAPEIFLKALAMVRNVAGSQGRRVENFTTFVCDLRELGPDVSKEPGKTDPAYFFRPWKTLLARTPGQGVYVRGNHAWTIPQLWTALAARLPARPADDAPGHNAESGKNKRIGRERPETHTGDRRGRLRGCRARARASWRGP